MDFVFINPSEIATRFFQVFERSLTIGVKLTDEFVPNMSLLKLVNYHYLTLAFKVRLIQ
jgi:hypothetical protein